MQSVSADEIATTTISLAELYFGAFNSGRVAANLEAVDAFRQLVHVILFDVPAAAIFGRMKSALKRQRLMVGDSDLLIASVALATDSTLVTNNTRHFNRIPGLKLDNWVTG